MSQNKKEQLNTNIWYEIPEQDNPYVAAKCYCSGYDVFGQLLTKASWFEYVFLLFRLEKPEKWQIKLLERVAIAIANPGIRDASIRAAMNAGAGGSTSASALMAAMAVGAGNLGGAREVFHCVTYWEEFGNNLEKWKKISVNKEQTVDSWPVHEHPPGFDPNGVSCSLPVRQFLDVCAEYEYAPSVKWLKASQQTLEKSFGMPLSMTSVVSAVLHDIGFSPDESEMLYLLLRLPGAAAHALEQKKLGYKQYPFFLDKLAIKR